MTLTYTKKEDGLLYPDLELKVTMLNVNDGHNLELMEHCRTLKEYAKYVARVRKYVTQNFPL